MVVETTIHHAAAAANLEEHLGYDDNAHPIICQIGGNSPELCSEATSAVLHEYGYDEINLNIDCPSERVTSGKREFGAILMKRGELAADIVRQMQISAADANGDGAGAGAADGGAESIHATSKVSVKCRIGVDEWDDLDFAANFIRTLRPVCRRFYLHARKCVLGGIMNARQNRSVPPLNYPRVYDLCRMFPDCEFWINGHIRTLRDAKLIAYGTSCLETNDRHIDNECEQQQHHQHQVPCQLCNAANGSCTEPPLVAPSNLRGCMMGRAAIDDPCLFHDVDRFFYGESTNPCNNRRDVLEKYCQYLEKTYPRRCCDSDERTTYEYPPPDVELEREYCGICAKIYCPDEVVIDESSVTYDNEKKAKASVKQIKPKIASRIIARSLKPVQGIFQGVPNSREFRRACDDLGRRDSSCRNCGPGFILRKAMQKVPTCILDQPFDSSSR